MWKSVKGYATLYEVNEFGQVRSLKQWNGHKYIKRGSPYILKQSNTATGYKKVELTKDGKKKSFKVHRLVAEAFIDNPYHKPNINHKDGNKRNNCVDNLEYVTPSENMSHAIEHSLNRVPKPDNRGERHGMSKLSNAQVLEIKNDLIAGEPVKEIAQKYNVSKSTIHDIKSGRTWLSIRI